MAGHMHGTIMAQLPWDLLETDGDCCHHMVVMQPAHCVVMLSACLAYRTQEHM